MDKDFVLRQNLEDVMIVITLCYAVFSLQRAKSLPLSPYFSGYPNISANLSQEISSDHHLLLSVLITH